MEESFRSSRLAMSGEVSRCQAADAIRSLIVDVGDAGGPNGSLPGLAAAKTLKELPSVWAVRTMLSLDARPWAKKFIANKIKPSLE
jgi:hypothetical protein